MTWYPVINDLVGGWAVADADEPLSQLDIKVSKVIAETCCRRDARLIADLLNKDETA